MKMYKFVSVLLVVCFFASCGSSKHALPKYKNKQVERLVYRASDYIHTPYKSGGNTPKGFDCSGFIQYIFKEEGYQLPRSTSEQVKSGERIKRKDIQPGDLVFFTGRNARSQKVGHVGMVVDANKNGNFIFVHASTSKGVTVTSSSEKYYKDRYLSARRIIAQ